MSFSFSAPSATTTSNAPDATAYVTGLIAAISDVYFEHVQTTLTIAYIGLHSTSADPWTAPDVGASAGALLSEFRSSWNSSDLEFLYH